MAEKAKTTGKGSGTAAPSSNRLFRRYLVFSILAVMLSILLLFIMFFYFLVNYLSTNISDGLMDNTREISDEIVSLVESDLMVEDNMTANLMVANMLNLISKSSDSDVFITDGGGNVVLCKDLLNANMELVSTSCSVHEGYTLPKDILTSTTAGGFRGRAELPGLYDWQNIIVGKKVVASGQTICYVYAVAPFYASLMPFIQQMIKLFFGAALIALLLTFMVAYLFAYSLSHPLQEMSRVTRQYAKGDFSERLAIKGDNEMEELADSLNTMAESLSVLEDSRKSFVANVSHELKTPMTSIAGFIDGILDGTIPFAQEKRYLTIVSKEVKRLARLVVTMLTLSKIEVGEEKLHYSETDMNELLFRALLSFETSINEAGYIIEGFEDMPQVKVPADEEMLFQVAYNLFDNAVKFTDLFGTIRVGMTADDERVTVDISNTGRGIPAEEIGRIFERFYKVDKSRSEHVKGVGLGLNLARDIIDLHHGEISVRSEEGFTTFSFWIPRNPEETTKE